MKSKIKKLVLLFTLIASIILSFQTVMAKDVSVDSLISQPGKLKPAEGTDPSYEAPLKAVSNLPAVSIEESVGIVIKTVLRWSFYLTIVSLVVASIYYIMSMGKEEDITKARNIILYLVIGMAIIAAAYGIISGVSRFNFFGADISPDKIQAAEGK